MPKIETRVYKVTGRQEDLDTLEKVFMHMEYLGSIGVGRSLTIRINESGLGRLRFRNENDERLDEKHNTIVDTEVDVQEYNALSGYYDIG